VRSWGENLTVDGPDPEEVCEYAGHEWGDAGGGLLICAVCQAEKWAPEPATDNEGDGQ
jgi:hypothetical protein